MKEFKTRTFSRSGEHFTTFVYDVTEKINDMMKLTTIQIVNVSFFDNYAVLSYLQEDN